MFVCCQLNYKTGFFFLFKYKKIRIWFQFEVFVCFSFFFVYFSLCCKKKKFRLDNVKTNNVLKLKRTIFKCIYNYINRMYSLFYGRSFTECLSRWTMSDTFKVKKKRTPLKLENVLTFWRKARKNVWRQKTTTSNYAIYFKREREKKNASSKWFYTNRFIHVKPYSFKWMELWFFFLLFF